MKYLVLEFGIGLAFTLGLTNCGTYQELSPGARSVTATTTRPVGHSCKSLGNLTGKGGGASGGYVSNESLIEYAVNDLRNQAASLGATHVVYSAPTMGGNQGTTTSAMVIGEALLCEPGNEAKSAPAKPDTRKAAGCEYDAQCKGDRVCVNRRCVDPAPSSTSGSASAPVPSAPQP